MTPLLAVDGLIKHFPLRGGLLNRIQAVVRAVDDVSFSVAAGETLGIVGESGCGKSTTARLLMHLVAADRGTIAFEGKAVGVGEDLSRRDLHRQMQMVFQDLYASLNPRLPVSVSIAFGPLVHGLAKSAALSRAMDLLEAVGLDPRSSRTVTRTSCRADSASASMLRAPSRWNRASSFSTKRCRLSTNRLKRRS